MKKTFKMYGVEFEVKKDGKEYSVFPKGLNRNVVTGKRTIKETIEDSQKRLKKHGKKETLKQIERAEKRDKKNKEFDKKVKTLEEKFGFKIKGDYINLMLGEKCLDIVWLEKKFGIRNKYISIEEYATNKYGKEAAELIKELI